jgi:hypothetical protein
MEPSTATSSSAQAKDKAQEMAGQAQEKSQEVAGQARDRVREQVDQRSTQAGEQLSSAADDARTVGQELRKQGKDRPAQLAEQAAQRAERLGGYLKDSDADTILRDIEDFGRRQPMAIAAAGLALGFLGSRFLKASSQSRYEQGRGAGAAHHDRGGQPGLPSGTGGV